MTNDIMTEEERINDDKLDFYFQEKVAVHITLKRKDNSNNKNIWLNGLLLKKAIPRVWIIKEDKLGEVRLSISEVISVEEKQ